MHPMHLIFTLMVMLESIGIGATSDDEDYRGQGQIARNVPPVSVIHDTLIQQADVERQPRIIRRRSHNYKMKLIPADSILRQEYYPENVEQALGKVGIQKRLRRDPNGETPVELDSAMPGGLEKAENLNEARAHDLEEIFQILARRDGQLLEQMLSLKSAIERLYGIFEFMGVASLPQNQRDAAIRKVLERSFAVQYAKRARRMRHT